MVASTLAVRKNLIQKNPMSRPRLIGLLLALVTLVAYLPVVRDSFSNFDDGNYVTNNRTVQNGLTWAGIQWAFTTWDASNWHPLTWLSHMLDCELFGLNAGAQHYVNVLFHTANAVLLFLLLLRLTGLRPGTKAGTSSPPPGALWPAAFVAALFAWHPLHVESVAWIAKRKNVLCTFFGLLTLLAYTRYVQNSESRSQTLETEGKRLPTSVLGLPVSGFYWLALFFFALGLMAKPMLVTLPFVMLLLDYWPLQRFPLFLRLALEKWPFFLLASASCVVTFIAQHNGGFVPTLQQVPLDLRLGNALLSYALYLGKVVWPAKLAVVYPMQSQLPWAGVAAAAVFLMVITWLAWRARQRCPYLLVGWLWFLGTLVPVIGLVQNYGEALSDRFTYIPLVGVFIAVAFGIKDLIARFQIGVVPTAAAAGLVLVSCLVLSERQLSYWRNDETLFSHAIAITKNNSLAYGFLGDALGERGYQTEAIANYQEALRINPNYLPNHVHLAYYLLKTGKINEALVQYQEAVKLNPQAPILHVNLGELLVILGRFDEAMSQYEQAVQLNPDDPHPYYSMGIVLLQQGRYVEAVDNFRKALRLDPKDFEKLAALACVLASNENPQIRNGAEAVTLAERANMLTEGQQPFVLDTLAMAYAEAGRFQDAQKIEQRAIRIARAAALEATNAMLQRLELYQNHQPWRESYLFTNAPAKN
jgi:tetratricopeptide (TPR) repeat protein